MSERYIVVKKSNSWHCCFVASVMDTNRGPRGVAVCETFLVEDAVQICALLNKAVDHGRADGGEALMACDICLKATDELTSLLDSHRTAEIRKICPACEKMVNKELDRIRSEQAPRLIAFMKAQRAKRKP